MEAHPPAETDVAPPATLPADLRLGPVHLTVTDLDRSVAFYGDALGLRLHRREDPVAALGTGGEDLLVLVEEPAARPPGRHAGLFHFALLHPSREELARAVVRLDATATPIDGASDHGVSEAIYLSDPDGNGIELYADRPRERWPAPGAGERVGMFTRPLDLRGLVDPVAGEEPRRHSGEGLAVGHLHLHVGDVDRGLTFYRDVLGFEEMVVLPGAAFVSAGGYHHHLGFNVWRGPGVPPAPADAVGLRHWTIILPGEADLTAARERLDAAGVEVEDGEGGLTVRDPWETRLKLVA
ncbi:MAG: VOC family protein [Thermoleophilaceae bacterium]|nr:VOC family protein [Thermoleophilaceae bacterium]